MAPNTDGGRQYTRDELLFLRDSPLVVKPPGLLSTAEWMGFVARSSIYHTRCIDYIQTNARCESKHLYQNI